MHGSFLRDIAIALSVAALVSLVARRLKLPTVLSYLGAGLIIGPYIPIPLFADPERLQSLSELGVILVMFTIGLEFRINRFVQVLPTAGVSAFFEVSMMGLVGLVIGYLFGWPTEQAIFLGGALAISSTMIVSKVFEEDPPSKEVKEHVLSILVIQDLVAILLITVLGTFAATKQLEFSSLIPTISKLLFVLVFSTIVGIFFIPKIIRYVARQNNSEVLTIVAIGICFGSALFVESMGYSVALGAFLAGILVAESGDSHRIEKTIRPLKDVFAAIFFVSIGMSVNPLIAFDVLPYSLFITAAVVFFQFATVFIGGVLSGIGAKKSLYSSFALGQIGEFAFIIAAIGVEGEILGSRFQAIIVSVAVMSSLCTPLLWKRADKTTHKILDWMPGRLRIAIGLYEAWFDRLRSSPEHDGALRYFGIPKKILTPLIVDTFLLLLIPPAVLRFFPDFVEALGPANVSLFQQVLTPLVLVILIAPIIFGFVKTTSQLVSFLSSQLLFESENFNGEHEAMRNLFSVMIWSTVIFLVGTPVLLVIRPFTNSTIVLIVLGAMFLFTLTWVWRRASEVANDFNSGGQQLVKVLKRQTFKESEVSSAKKEMKIPGLENIEAFELNNNRLIGKSLRALDIRTHTGVTVVSIQRGDEQIMFPTQDVLLKSGDILQIWGSPEAKETCKKFLNK